MYLSDVCTVVVNGLNICYMYSLRDPGVGETYRNEEGSAVLSDR